MGGSAIRRIVEQSPPGTQFTREGLLSVWGAGGEQGSRWVGTTEAGEITGTAEGTLRSAAPRWREMMERGQSPPIRVRKKGPAPRSPWLFDEADCWALRRSSGGGPRPVEDLDERQQLLQHWAGKVVANL
jgi:hypothetical protein